MNPTFQVQFSYYQHNTGAADNGNYTRTLDFDTKAEALAVADRIQAVIEEKANEEETQETFARYHPYTGHFSWVRVYEVIRKEIDVPMPRSGLTPSL